MFRLHLVSKIDLHLILNWHWSFGSRICLRIIVTRSSWLNSALRDDEPVYCVSIGHYEAGTVGNWWYWVSRGHLCLYILHKVEIWTGVTDAWLTDWQTTLKDRATQLLIKYKSGALVTQYILKHQKALQLALMVFSLFNPYCMFTFVASSA